MNQLLTEVISIENSPAVLQAKNKIAMSIEEIKSSQDFQKTLNEYHFILEQILFLSAFIKPTQGLEEAIQVTLPEGEREKGTILCYNSGMACFDYILEIVRKEHEESKPKLFIQPGSYYELKKELGALIRHLWDLQEGHKFADMLFLDLYPNDVTLEDVQESPVQKIITKALKERKRPLTVVIDLSTTLLTHPRIWEIKKELEGFINNEQLRLILVTSLAKFYSCGFDKFTGGALVYFGKDKDLPNQLKKARDQDPMSDEAKVFFSLMIRNAMKGVELFYEKSLENTNLFYEHIKSSNIQTVTLKTRADNIPVIGLSSPSTYSGQQEDWVKEVEAPLSKAALDEGYPLFVRASFPFPHSAVVECDTALRWIAGLDTPSNKDKYVDLIRKTSKILLLPTSQEG